MVQLFIDGGGFMWPILGIFIIGLVFVIERLVHLVSGLSAGEEFAISVANTVGADGINKAKSECEEQGYLYLTKDLHLNVCDLD